MKNHHRQSHGLTPQERRQRRNQRRRKSEVNEVKDEIEEFQQSPRASKDTS